MRRCCGGRKSDTNRFFWCPLFGLTFFFFGWRHISQWLIRRGSMHGNNGNASQVLLSKQKKDRYNLAPDSDLSPQILASASFCTVILFLHSSGWAPGPDNLKFLASARRLRTACNFHLQRRNRNRRAPTPLEGPLGCVVTARFCVTDRVSR